MHIIWCYFSPTAWDWDDNNDIGKKEIRPPKGDFASVVNERVPLRRSDASIRDQSLTEDARMRVFER